MSSLGPLGVLYRVWGDGKQMVPGDIFDNFGLSGYSADQLKSKGYILWTPPRPKGEFPSSPEKQPAGGSILAAL